MPPAPDNRDHYYDGRRASRPVQQRTVPCIFRNEEARIVVLYRILRAFAFFLPRVVFTRTLLLDSPLWVFLSPNLAHQRVFGFLD